MNSPFARIQQADIVVKEKLPEVAGLTQLRSTAHRGYFERLDAESRRASGNDSANAALAMLDPEGYGTSWSLKPGDTIENADIVSSVLRTRAVTNPRTGKLHHIEAECG